MFSQKTIDNKHERIIIPLYVNGNLVSALVDPGAEVTAISKRFALVTNMEIKKR